MQIQKIKTHNFRSMKDLEMECDSLAVLLGPNNHGKSNILAALEFHLSNSLKPKEEDFFAFRNNEDNLWVELTFRELTDQEKRTFKKYLRSDSTICIRKTALMNDGKIEVTYNGYVEEPKEFWLKGDSVDILTKRDESAKTPLKDLVPSGRLTKAIIQEVQSNYIEANKSNLDFEESLEKSNLLGTKNVASGVLPEFYLVPAVRDLSEDTKTKSSSNFGRLIDRAVSEMAAREPKFVEIKNKLESLVRIFNEGTEEEKRPEQMVLLEKGLELELKDWGVSVAIEVQPPEIEKVFELGTSLHLDDGHKTLASQKGHGLQRAVIFALIKSWANALRKVPSPNSTTVPRASSESVVFAIEEPELFLHPHAQRQLAMSILGISKTPEHQAFVCTHSSHFVDLNYYKNISIISKPSAEEGTSVRQCRDDLFEGEGSEDRGRKFHMAHWVNPDRGEMFFAKKVVFVEGETEKAIFPFLATKLDILNHEVSIIDCGSKYNLPLYIAIANAFKLSYVVVHDVDPLPNPIPSEWSSDKERGKRRTFDLNKDICDALCPLNGKVETFDPDFEAEAGISRTQASKKGKALAALDFFENKSAEDIPERISLIIKSLFLSG
jgi:putative ATP-dependent endonuclease of the OLD family